MKKEVVESENSRNLWIEKKDGNWESFIWYAQIFSDKARTTLNIKGFMTYPFSAILLNVWSRKIQSLIDNGNMLVCFLRVYYNAKSLKRKKSAEGKNAFVWIYIIYHSAVGERRIWYCRFSGRKQRMRVLPDIMKVVTRVLRKYQQKWFVVKTNGLLSDN